MVTPGTVGLEPTVTDVDLTALTTHNVTMNTGDLFTISCKMIGSNTATNDALHFGSATQVRIMKNEDIPSTFDSDRVNKFAMIALGIVVEKQIVPDSNVPGGLATILTIKAVDKDPVVSVTLNDCAGDSGH